MSKSAVARGASMAASVCGKLDGKVKAKGGTEDAIHILDKQEGDALLDAVADLLVRAELKTRDRFAVAVDYAGLTDDPDAWLQKQIAAGQYGYVNPHITSANFPITGTGTLETELVIVHFDRDMGSDDAEKELQGMGLEPAKLEHACALGAKHPDLQRQYPIVFLGSVWTGSSGYRSVTCLDDWGAAKRGLDLRVRDGGWDALYRFAAVRKSPVL